MRRPPHELNAVQLRPIVRANGTEVSAQPSIGSLISRTARLAREASAAGEPVRLRNGEHPRAGSRFGLGFGLLV